MPIDRGADGTPIIRCVDDIKEVIKDFLPGSAQSDQQISTTMESDGHKYNVSVDLKNQDPKCQLIEGFDIVKRRLEVLEKLGNNKNAPITVDGHMWLDDLIRMRMGGSRDGLRVKWVIRSDTYLFDPYTGKLFKRE